jgi:hypothetical protein
MILMFEVVIVNSRTISLLFWEFVEEGGGFETSGCQ